MRPYLRAPSPSCAVATLIAVAALFATTTSARAQSITTGSVNGVVYSTEGVAVPQALVTLEPIGAGTGRQTTTASSGTFSFRFVQPGTYEMRIEALGFRPLVARILTVNGGEERTVDLRLTREPPPVLSVDTVSLGTNSVTRWRAGAVQFGTNEIDAPPHRFEDIASVAALSSAFDESMGSQGLPGDMTLIIADGIPFYRAPHPTALSEFTSASLFPTSALAGVTAFHDATDVEWSGSAGGYLGLATRSSTPGGGVALNGAWSGDALWSSSLLDIDTPALTSYRGGIGTTVSLDDDDASRLFVFGETQREETPLAPRVGEGVAAALAGMDPALLSTLTAPAVESLTRYSGMARVDIQNDASNRFFLRGAGGHLMREFNGAGPVSLSGAPALAEKSTEFSVATGLVNQYSDEVTIEVRGGVSGSYRDFGSAIADQAPAYLVESATTLGTIPSAEGKSSRLDFSLVPVLRLSPGSSRFETGATVRVSSHTMDHSRADVGDFVYADAAALLAGRGYVRATTSPEASFSSQEYGVFAEYEAALSPDVRFIAGARADYERIGGNTAALNPNLQRASGLINSEYPDAFTQFSTRGSLTWQPSASNLRFHVTGSIHEGDVDTRAYYRLFSETGNATEHVFVGSDLPWPEGGLAGILTPPLPTMTLLGPDTRAPRTTNLGVGIAQRVGENMSIYVRGSTRRTDFLLRRRNLNLPIMPSAVDPNGRGIFADLTQDGALVTATGTDVRRFSDFGSVWALDPDGWSEYVGVTAGLEHSSPKLDLYASYTYSETTDNWVGAATGALGGTLRPGLPEDPESPHGWSEGVSDFDAPHRMTGVATMRFGSLSVSGTYRFRSGLPFTPGYRLGVDANGDGSIRNDVAFVPENAEVAGLLEMWPCLEEQMNGFAVRNSCRRPSVHSVDVRLQFRLGRIGNRAASLTVDGIGLIEGKDGVVDNALMLVDPSGTITNDGTTVTIPMMINPDFGQILYPSTRGRVLRIGVRVGG